MVRQDAVLLAGPTASGKSALALELAEELGGAVVNADSMQVHSALRVVSARPDIRDEARVPHLLYGHVPPLAPMSAAIYLNEVFAALQEVAASGRIPIFVGGTGLYLRALEEGLSVVPPVASEVRNAVRSLDTPALAAALSREDPVAAAALRPSDTQRLARALEVMRSSGRSLLEWQAVRGVAPLAGRSLRRILLMPDRAVLHERIERRARMIVESEAAKQEVRELLEVDPDRRSAAARAIGVMELSAFLAGDCDVEEAVRRLSVATRRYAKRQCTWFNNGLRGEWQRRSS